MKALIAILLFLSATPGRLNAQATGQLSHSSENYKQIIYLDQLDQRLMPDILKQSLYGQLKSAKLKIDSQMLDAAQRERILYTRSKKAQDGFAWVNKELMRWIKTKSFDADSVKLQYLINEQIVNSKILANRLLALRKEKIGVSKISYDDKLKLIRLFVSEK